MPPTAMHYIWALKKNWNTQNVNIGQNMQFVYCDVLTQHGPKLKKKNVLCCCPLRIFIMIKIMSSSFVDLFI